MAYQPPQQPHDPRAVAFANAANHFFGSIDAYIRVECSRLQTQPSLSTKDVVSLERGLEARREITYKQFLADARTHARLSTALVDKDPELVAVFGKEPSGYTRQALAHYRELLGMRVLRTATLEAGQRANPVEMWSVLEQYASAYNARNIHDQIHTRLTARGQTYDAHFGRSNPELDYFQLLPILDAEIRTRSPQDARLARVNPKAWTLLSYEIVKRIDAIVMHDAASTKQKLTSIKQAAFARVSKSRRATTMFQIRTHDLEELLRSSSSDGDE